MLRKADNSALWAIIASLVLFFIVFVIVGREVELERIGIADHERLTAFVTTDFVAEIHIIFIHFNICIALGASGHTILDRTRAAWLSRHERARRRRRTQKEVKV